MTYGRRDYKIFRIRFIIIIRSFNQVNKCFHKVFGIQRTNCVTISGISLKLYLDKYYNKSKSPLPLITDRKVWEDIHKAYYGGRVEVFNPLICKGLAYHYDVNSLYPFASLNTMPGLNCVYIECIKEKVDLKDLFGFFYCKIKTTNNYLGLLPYRTFKGSLVFP